MATTYNRTGDIDFKIDAGVHFCTKFDIDSDSGPPVEWAQMCDARELAEIWVADSWLMNLDREKEGNIRLKQDGKGAFHLIAADQSDLCLGALSFRDGSYIQRSRNHGAAQYPAPFVERAICDHGCDRIHALLGKIVARAKTLPDVIRLVPQEWFLQAGISASDLCGCLCDRANRLRSIIDVERLEGMRRVAAQQGVRLL